MIAEPLFSMKPPKAPEDPPAWRDQAEQVRDLWLDGFRRHQGECARCAAWATPAPGKRPIDMTCNYGFAKVYIAAVWQAGIRAGHYPARPRKAARRPRTAPPADPLFSDLASLAA
jgi:hypothetical protein